MNFMNNNIFGGSSGTGGGSDEALEEFKALTNPRITTLETFKTTATSQISALETFKTSTTTTLGTLAKTSDLNTQKGRIDTLNTQVQGIITKVDLSQGIQSGATTDAPTTAKVGEMYFDTTLNKPIWRNATNDGWVDATGTAIV